MTASRIGAISLGMDDWNELRLVLAVQREGSLTGAAKALNVDHSTAFRRLNALEKRVGVHLFERLPGGLYQATVTGERMAATAERIEDETLALDRDIAGSDHRLSGRLRVTSSETLAYSDPFVPRKATCGGASSVLQPGPSSRRLPIWRHLMARLGISVTGKI